MKHSSGPWIVDRTIKGAYVRRSTGSLGEAAICKVLKVPGKGRLLEREQGSGRQCPRARRGAGSPGGLRFVHKGRARMRRALEQPRVRVPVIDRLRRRAGATRDRKSDRRISPLNRP